MQSMKPTSGRLIIVSNRLSFTARIDGDQLAYSTSLGGLATGLTSYIQSLGPDADYLWLGWPGATVEEDRIREEIRAVALSEYNSYPVFLSEEEMENFYHGFCNKVIWPLFHYFPSYATYKSEYWVHYEQVNRAFCEALVEVVQPGDEIWVHDYHLMLLPALVRERLPDAKIGFFLHIPFPSLELFRLLPRQWANAILDGLLGANLVGFHTQEYARHFLTTVHGLLGQETAAMEVQLRDRRVSVGTFPMGIDYETFRRKAHSEPVQQIRSELTSSAAGEKIVLSIDRLDYTKGIVNRLQAYEAFLEQCQEWHGRVALALMIIPSRVAVEHYSNTLKEINELVGHINGRFGTMFWVPVRNQYRPVPFKTLVGLYAASDVALVTPLRDGMNLIAKEYVASRVDGKGVLVLSEMAGAARELRDAILVNPNDRGEMVAALRQALEMPEAEQIARNDRMRAYLKQHDVKAWAESFMRQLRRAGAPAGAAA